MNFEKIGKMGVECNYNIDIRVPESWIFWWIKEHTTISFSYGGKKKIFKKIDLWGKRVVVMQKTMNNASYIYRWSHSLLL